MRRRSLLHASQNGLLVSSIRGMGLASINLLHSFEDGSAGGETTTVSDHSISRHNAPTAIDLPLTSLSTQLDGSLHHANHSAACTCLTGRKLPTASVDGKGPFISDPAVTHEIGGLPARAQTESFHLHEHHDRIVVVKLSEIELVRPNARARVQPVREAGPSGIERIDVGRRIVVKLCPCGNCNLWSG